MKNERFEIKSAMKMSNLRLGAFFIFHFSFFVLLAGCSGDAPKAPKKGYAYRTAPISRTDIVRSVSATGTITPRNTSSGIPVGAQVNGKLIKLYVDYNDVVTNGQIVAEIDPLVYEATYKSSLARLHETEAAVLVSECTLKEREAAKLLAEKTYARKKALVDKSMASVADLDAAIEALDSAAAAVESAKASLASSKASVESAQASVDQAAANLSYCTIRSPVDGIIIDRKVEEGETVVSSMNAVPVLSIAEDLDTIWVAADVPEADVGGIRVGQRVTFTVDAYTVGGRPREFTGHVKQIRKASTTTNNVVTFPVIVEAENPEQMLFPGMTATLAIETARAEDVLAVSAAAFRFRPKDEDKARVQGEIERGPKLWLTSDAPGGVPEYVIARQGVTDDSFTEIVADDVALLEGREAIVGYMTSTSVVQEGDRNPFMPKPPQKSKGKAPEPKQ